VTYIIEPKETTFFHFWNVCIESLGDWPIKDAHHLKKQFTLVHSHNKLKLPTKGIIVTLNIDMSTDVLNYFYTHESCTGYIFFSFCSIET
jgi:hypothetical protein